jgi:hypothetical protein
LLQFKVHKKCDVNPPDDFLFIILQGYGVNYFFSSLL